MRVWAWLVPAGWLAVAGAAAGEVTISRLEVTQGVQTAANGIDLVARRSTTVRAFLHRAAGEAATSVRGKLHVRADGHEITPPAGLPAKNEPFAPPAAPSRDVEVDSLNFDLGSVPDRFVAGKKATFTVDLEPGGATAAVDLDVVEPLGPVIYLVRIRYGPHEPAVPAPSPSDVSHLGDMLRAMFPVADRSDALIVDGGEQPFNFTHDDDLTLNYQDEYDQLLLKLEWWRQTYCDRGDLDHTFVYGCVPCEVKWNGYGQMPGRVGFGSLEGDRCQRTFAHEVGHMLSLDHPTGPEKTTETGWDVLGRLGGGRAKPRGLFDVMVPMKLTDEAWIDDGTYRKLLKVGLTEETGVGMADDVLLVQGTIGEREPGHPVASIEPVFRLPWKARPASEKKAGRFTVRVTGADGSVVARRFDAWNSSAEGDRAVLGAFSVMVPLPGAVRAARLEVLDGGERRIGVLDGSPQATEVTVVSPRKDEKLRGKARVAWKGRHEEPRNVAYHVLLTTDDGHTFVPVQLGLKAEVGKEEREASIDIDPARILPVKGRAKVRVLASDGLNTTCRDSEAFEIVTE